MKEYFKLCKQEQIEKEAVEMGNWFVDHKITIRQLAKEFCVSRMTAYNRITRDLKNVNSELYERCKYLLNTNKSDCINRMVQARKPRK